jgi:drug/metabolite transporter (DMT)-like permease
VNSIFLRLDVADGVMLAVVLLWALNNVAIKFAVADVAPLPYVVARFAIVLVLVWAWIALRRVPARVARSDVPLLILVGVSGFAVFNALVTVGMTRTSAFSVALLMNLSPVFALMMARVLGLERPTPAQWLSVAVALTGVALFVGDTVRGDGFGLATTGDLLGLLAAIAFAVYSFAARPVTVRYGATVTTAWAVLIGLAAIAPWGIPAAFAQPWVSLSPAVWGAIFYAGAGAMLVGYSLWSWAVARRGMSRTVPYLFLVPIGTGVFSALLLGEVFTVAKIAGAALVLLGTAGVRLLGAKMASESEVGSRESRSRGAARSTPVRSTDSR